MNTRYDKTESVQKFQRRYGNAQRTANAVWRSITNPILINDFNMLSNDKMYNKYIKEQVKTGRAVGELNHPDGPTINLDKVSHKITELRWEGDDVVGKASILKTPMGKIVEGLLEGGVRLGVSSRGMGTLVQKNGTQHVGKDFMLATVDIVQDPSAPGAFVDGIMEGVDWVWNNGILVAQEIEEIETEIKEAKNMNSADVEIRAFKNFLSKLNSKI